MGSRRIFIVLVVISVVLAAVIVQRFWLAAPANRTDRIKVSGNIEVIDVQVSFKIAGRIEERPVDEGQWVNKGQLVARLETADLQQELASRTAEAQAAQGVLDELLAGSRDEEIAAAKAQLERATALMAELDAGTRPQEIAVAEATLARAQAERDRLESEYRRAAQLNEQKMIAVEQFDRARSAFDVGVAQLREAALRLELAKEGPRHEQKDQAREALRQAQAQYDLVKAGPRRQVIAVGRARFEQAQAALRLAQTRLEYATLKAPMSGVVVSKNTEPGEYVAPGTPVVTIGDLKNVWLRAYIQERDHVRVKPGQKAQVLTDTYPGKIYEGRVSFISPEAEFTPKTVQTQQERVKLVYRIKIDIDNPNLELKPGTPADAEILLDSPSAQGPAATVSR